MIKNFTQLYGKYAIYIILLLYILIIIAFIQPNFILNFFNIAIKIIPKTLINYIENTNITIYETFYFSSLIFIITGLTTLWKFIFHNSYYYLIYIKVLDKNQFATFPRFYMDSVYNLMSEISTILFLIFILLLKVNIVSLKSITSFSLNFFLDNKSISLLAIIGLIRAFLICIAFLFSFLGIIEPTKNKKRAN